MLRTFSFPGVLLLAAVFIPYAPAQQTSPNPSSTSSPDVPHQEPGPDNPDVGKQRHGNKNDPGGSYRSGTAPNASKTPDAKSSARRKKKNGTTSSSSSSTS